MLFKSEPMLQLSKRMPNTQKKNVYLSMNFNKEVFVFIYSYMDNQFNIILKVTCFTVVLRRKLWSASRSITAFPGRVCCTADCLLT